MIGNWTGVVKRAKYLMPSPGLSDAHCRIPLFPAASHPSCAMDNQLLRVIQRAVSAKENSHRPVARGRKQREPA
jgi:hypothetical protein